MKKAMVIYDTRFGNTEKIAKTLTLGMKEQGVNVDCFKVEEVSVDKVAEYDFLAVGGPTHRLGISETMKEFLEELETVDVRGKNVFCFDTRKQSSFNRFDLNSAAKRIEKKMKKMKAKTIKSHESALVEGREGPLKDGTEEQFKQIGAKIAELIQ